MVIKFNSECGYFVADRCFSKEDYTDAFADGKDFRFKSNGDTFVFKLNGAKDQLNDIERYDVIELDIVGLCTYHTTFDDVDRFLEKLNPSTTS